MSLQSKIRTLLIHLNLTHTKLTPPHLKEQRLKTPINQSNKSCHRMRLNQSRNEYSPWISPLLFNSNPLKSRKKSRMPRTAATARDLKRMRSRNHKKKLLSKSRCKFPPKQIPHLNKSLTLTRKSKIVNIMKINMNRLLMIITINPKNSSYPKI